MPGASPEGFITRFGCSGASRRGSGVEGKGSSDESDNGRWGKKTLGVSRTPRSSKKTDCLIPRGYMGRKSRGTGKRFKTGKQLKTWGKNGERGVFETKSKTRHFGWNGGVERRPCFLTDTRRALGQGCSLARERRNSRKRRWVSHGAPIRFREPSPSLQKTPADAGEDGIPKVLQGGKGCPRKNFRRLA